MAGFREFAAGEPLTATNVDDFLAKQAVMKFADAAARDLALGTAVVSPNALREGMIAYLDDTDDVLKYDGSAWASIGAAGIRSNVVQTVKTDAFTKATDPLADITGLSVTITPTSASSKILVLYSLMWSHSSSGGYYTRLVRDSTDIYLGSDNASSNGSVGGINSESQRMASGVYLDSPATTSATTYKLRIAKQGGGTLYVGRRAGGSNFVVPSQITVVEVAA